MNIVITGGRAPVALELVRNFGRHGHSVYVAESLRVAMTRGSRYVRRFFTLPSPRFHEQEYIDILIRIVRDTYADILIPTCEEAFYLSRNLKQFQAACPQVTIDVDTIESMQLLHNKATFTNHAASLGIAVPRSTLVQTTSEFNAALTQFEPQAPIVIKPTHSRFGNRVIISQQSAIPKDLRIVSDNPMLVQEYIEGELVCAYAYARSGIVRVSVIYRGVSQGPNKPLTTFEQLQSTEIEEYLSRVIRSINYSGHISFDFIVHNHRATMIECNPRTTSGLHIIGEGTDLAEVFYGAQLPKIRYENRQLLIVNLLRREIVTAAYRQKLFAHKDSIFTRHDPLPTIWAFFSIASFQMIARKQKISLIEAMTHDIQWDGPIIHTPNSPQKFNHTL